MLTVERAARLTLPAYTGADTPRYARPVGETSEAVNAPIRQKLQFLQSVRDIIKRRVHDAKPVSAGKTQASDAPGSRGGSGIVVTLTNSRKPFFATATSNESQPNLIHAAEVREAVNELNAAGAKAIAVNGQRILAVDTVQQARTTILFDKMVINNVNQILIDHTPQNSPYVIKAIGNSKSLTAALNKPHSLAARIKAYDPSMFSIQQSTMLTVPAYPGNRPMPSAKLISAGAAQSVSVQQMTAKPAPSASTTQNQTIAGTHTIVGYGLVSWTLGQVRQCRAVTNSPASRAGVPTESNSVILAVNGQRVPPSDAQLTAVCRSSPALHLLLASINRKKPYPVTISAKGSFSVLTDAAAAEDQEKYLQSAQADAATAKAALPQASASTLEKALNLEKRIGWSLSGQKFWIEIKAASQKKNHPQSVAKFQRYEEEASDRLVEATAKENALFPKTTGTPQALSRIHALAVQSYVGSITGMEKQIIEQVAESMVKQRGPQTAF